MASLGPTLNLRPNGASPRCLTVVITDTSSSKSVSNNNIITNPFDSNRHSYNPFGDDDDYDDDDNGGGFGVGRRGSGYVYSLTFGTDRGSLHQRIYPSSSTSLPSSSSRYDSGGGSSVISGNRGGNARGGDQTMTDPSRLAIEPIDSDSIDLRGSMNGSIVSILRYDTLPIFLVLVDDNNSHHRPSGGSGGGGGDTSKDPGAYAAHLTTVRNGTFHKIDNADNELSINTGNPLPRMTCAAYHPDAGYVYASGTGVYGLFTIGITTAISSSISPPIAVYLGCARCLPPPGARTSSSGGHQDNMTLCCSGRVAIVAVANTFYSVPCYLTRSGVGGGVSSNVQSVTAMKIASFGQSSQVHPVIVVEILADANSLSTRASYSTSDESLMRPITSLVFLASGRECSTVEITSLPNGSSSSNIGGEGIVPTTVKLTSRSQKKHGSYTATLPSPILAVASVPPIAAARGESSSRGSSSVCRRGGDLSSGPLIVLLTVDGLVHVRSPSCIAVALTSVEVGTRPNDFFTLSLLPLPPISRAVGKRTVVATSYGGESRLITVDDRESTQDFADRLMRLSIDAFGPNGFPRLELAEASGATFSATSYTGSGGGGGGEQESSSSSTAALSHKRALLKQYLESVLGLTDDARAWVSSSSSPQRTPVLLQMGDDMEVEAVDILSLDERDEESNVATISSLGANSLLTCTTLLCLVCYQLSSPDGVTAIRSSKACASAMGISSSSTFSKAAVAVCEIVADRLLKEVTSSSMASISLLAASSPSPIVSSYASSTNFVMEFIESSIWLLRACGSHEKAINALQTRLDSPAFRNSMGGGGGKGTTNSAGATGGWSQIKFDSYIATHLGELWSSNDDRYRRIVLLSSATRDLIQREPTLGLSVFTMMNPRNENEWRQTKPEDDPLIHPTYPPKIVELLRSITPHQSIGAGGSSDEQHQLLSSFSDGSPKASSPLPLNSGRSLAVAYLESAIGIDTGRPSFPDTRLDSSSDEIDERKADMHDELYYLLLEGVISERGDDKGEDTKLGAFYRVKLWRLLSWPNSKIRSDKLLSSVPSSFLHERALLLGRLGRHEDALRILYSQEKGLDLALEYCDTRHERCVAAQMKEIKGGRGGVGSSKALHHECSYTPLIKVALSTDPDQDRGIAAAIQVLALRRGVINKAAALRLMPKTLPMSSIARPFLIPAMVENESEVRRLTMASSLLRSRYIQLKQRLTDAQLKSQASLHSTPALQQMNLGEPLHSSKPTKARLVHAPSSFSPDITLIKHFFSRHLVIQARVNNGAAVPLTNVTFVVAESSDDALVLTMELPLKTVPPGAIGSAWCVLSASPQRLDGSAFLTCELRFTVLEVDATTGIPTSFSEGTNPGPGNGRIYVEELHDIEVRHTEFQ